MKVNCINCKEEWGICEEDWNSEDLIEYRCPLCEMPIMEMIRDVLKTEGIFGVPFIIKLLFLKCK